VWDAAIAICGVDLYEFRDSYPRKLRYAEIYTRQTFEALCQRYKEKRPYLDDERYPRSGGDSDRWWPEHNDDSGDKWGTNDFKVSYTCSDKEDTLSDDCNDGGAAL